MFLVTDYWTDLAIPARSTCRHEKNDWANALQHLGCSISVHLIDKPSITVGSKYELEALAPPSLTHPLRDHVSTPILTP